jgi:phage-related protein
VDKPIIWMAQTLKQLRAMPEDVKDEVGFALDAAQKGARVPHARPMKGNLRAVTEIRIDDDGDTYRTMYTTELEGVVYVLDAFKKKSKKGSETPREDIDRILERLKRAREHFERVKDKDNEDT